MADFARASEETPSEPPAAIRSDALASRQRITSDSCIPDTALTVGATTDSPGLLT